jgi:hypothetical protein
MDYGFRLADILERIDDPTNWLSSVETIDMLVQDCKTSISEIEYLKLELLVDPVEYLKNLGPNPGSDPWDAIEIQDINRRMLRLTAAGIQLHLVAAAHEAISKARNLAGSPVTITNLSDVGSNVYLLRDDCDSLTLELLHSGTQMAKDLIDEMEDTIKDGKGAVIRGRLRFPLRAALNQLRYEPACDQYVQGEYLMQALLGRRYDEALNGPHKKDEYFMGRAQQKQQVAFDGLQRGAGSVKIVT